MQGRLIGAGYLEADPPDTLTLQTADELHEKTAGQPPASQGRSGLQAVQVCGGAVQGKTAGNAGVRCAVCTGGVILDGAVTLLRAVLCALLRAVL